MNGLHKRKKGLIRLIFFASVFPFLLNSCSLTKSKLDIISKNTYESMALKKNEDNKTILRVLSFNIKNADDGKNIEGIAEEIKAQNADLVFLQEIDNKAKRSSKIDILSNLSELLEMNYAYFPAIEYQGGAYGIGILCKLQLNNTETFRLESGEEESRVLAKAEISIGGKTLSVFNTHLSFESKELRLEQLKFINETLSKTDNFILGGDFNVCDFEEYSFIKDVSFVNEPENQFSTFNESKEGSFACIDNIIFSNSLGLEHSWMTGSKISDHNMLAAVILI